MNARSYLGQWSWRFAKLGAVAAVVGSASTVLADPPLTNLPQQFRGEGKVTETEFFTRGYGSIEPSYKAVNGTLMTIESLIPPITKQPTREDTRTRFCFADCTKRELFHIGIHLDELTSTTAALTLERARRAQEIAMTPPSAKRATGWSFTTLGFVLGGLGVAGALGEFDPTRNRLTAAGRAEPNDWSARAVAGTTFLAMGAPIVCVGVWALLSPDPIVRDAHGHYVAHDTIPIGGGIGLGPQGLVF